MHEEFFCWCKYMQSTLLHKFYLIWPALRTSSEFIIYFLKEYHVLIQVEEVEALKAIYDADFSSNHGAHSIRIQSDDGVTTSSLEFSLKLQVSRMMLIYYEFMYTEF